MTEKRVPKRDEINPEYTWNAESVFPSTETWEAEVTEVKQAIADVGAWQGRLDEGPVVLGDALDAIYGLVQSVSKIYV
jgi:oligoendopeptidase F